MLGKEDGLGWRPDRPAKFHLLRKLIYIYGDLSYLYILIYV